MALAYLLKFLGMAEQDRVNNHKQWPRCLPEMANSKRDGYLLSKPSLDMISSLINSVSERANICDNFSIH